MIELLETRIAPAGIVTVEFTAGILTLTGDTAGNEIEVLPAGPDGFRIVGQAGTTLNDAVQSVLVFDGPLKGITADLLGGADRLALRHIDVAGSVTVLGGADMNTFVLESIVVRKDLTYTGEAAADTVSFENGTSHIVGTFAIDLADGADSVLSNGPAALRVGGSFHVLGGAGADTFSLNLPFLHIGKNLLLDGGTDNTAITLQGNLLTVGGSATVRQGSHAGLTQAQFLNDTVRIGGTFDLGFADGENSARFSSNGDFGVRGKLIFNGGSGADSLSIDGNAFTGGNAFTVNLGEGANQLVADPSRMRVSGPFVINSGTGADTVDMTGTQLSLGGATFNLGNGANNLNISNSDLKVAGALAYAGGDAADTFSANALSMNIGKGINANLGGAGNNSFSLGGSVLTIGGASVITGGTGSDEISFGGTNLRFLGTVTFQLDSGVNKVSFNTSTVVFGGAVNYTGGSGDDEVAVSVSELRLLKGFSTTLGEGNNEFRLGGSEVALTGKISMAGGAGPDNFSLSGGTVQSKASISLDYGGGDVGFFMGATDLVLAGKTALILGDHAANSASLSVGGASVSLAGGFTVTDGAGNTNLNISPNASLNIKGGLKFSGGDGDENLSFSVPELTLSGDLVMDGGAGTHNTSLSVSDRLAATGGLRITGLGGSDSVNITGNGTFGAVNFLAGAGINTLSISGAGNDAQVSLKALTFVSESGSAEFDSLSLTRANLRGASKITLGASGSSVNMDNFLAAGAFTLDTGDGNDNVSLERNAVPFSSIVRAPMTIRLGAGNDSLSIGQGTETDRVRFFAKLLVDGGEDPDTVNDIEANNVFAPKATVTVINL